MTVSYHDWVHQRGGPVLVSGLKKSRREGFGLISVIPVCLWSMGKFEKNIYCIYFYWFRIW